MIAPDVHLLKSLTDLTTKMAEFVQNAAASGQATHEVERQLWKQLLSIGHTALGQFFALQGTGDIGPTFERPDQTTAHRLEHPHPRTYRSVFGSFTLSRTVYGSREGQKIQAVPLDARLQLPASDYSYLLQEWDQMLGCEHSFGQVSRTLEEILGQTQSVDSLETMNRQMADTVEPFRDSRPIPEAQAEGEIFVLSVDGKGVVIRRDPKDAKPPAHRRRGEKANKKRMAMVGSVYSVKKTLRTPEEIVAALFRDPRDSAPSPRPVPVGKHVWARLSQAANGSLDEPLVAVFGWLNTEWTARTANGPKETVLLMDGQELLWTAGEEHWTRGETVEVLDLLHVTPQLWQSAHLFHQEGSDEAVAWVRHRLGQILAGQVDTVVRSFRQLGRTLTSARRKKLRTICRYLASNSLRMKYDEYLRKGYPIASGVIEGACRHYVKDRMERAGMRWSKVGVQAMLDVRSEFLNGDWNAFQKFRVEHESDRLYPYRKLLDPAQWPIAA
ncbi:MAG: ISKra4 family transposase [Bacteroidales bacterium]|nr:ISKra4 family transposase [Bacteroidales bacterium]